MTWRKAILANQVTRNGDKGMAGLLGNEIVARLWNDDRRMDIRSKPAGTIIARQFCKQESKKIWAGLRLSLISTMGFQIWRFNTVSIFEI